MDIVHPNVTRENLLIVKLIGFLESLVAGFTAEQTATSLHMTYLMLYQFYFSFVSHITMNTLEGFFHTTFSIFQMFTNHVSLQIREVPMKKTFIDLFLKKRTQKTLFGDKKYNYGMYMSIIVGHSISLK